MKKDVKITLLLFFLSIFVNTIHRAWQSDNTMIYPFVYEVDIPISIAWYTKHICEFISFTLIMLCVCYILRPVEKHLMEVKWVGHNALLVFVRVWHRIFWVVVVISVLDLVHYLLSFRQTEWFFLIQNAIFLIMTSYYLYKAYKK